MPYSTQQYEHFVQPPLEEYAPESPQWKYFMNALKMDPQERTEEHTERMMDFLSQMSIFEFEPPTAALLDQMSVETYRKETTILEISSIHDIQNQKNFFFVLTGNISVHKSDQMTSYTIPASHTFGEVIISKSLLLSNHAQQKDSLGGSAGTPMSRSGSGALFESSRTQPPQGRYAVRWQFKTSQAEETVVLSVPMDVYAKELQQRWESDLEERCRFLKRCHVPIFARIEYALLLEMSKQMRKHKLRARSVLCKQDTCASTMFFLVSGECKVLRHLLFEEAQGREHKQYVKFLELATYKPREYFGELVLLNYDMSGSNPPRRQCSIFTVSNETEVLSLNYHTFSIFFTEWMVSIMEEYAEGYPEMAEIANLFVKRTRWQQYKANLVNKLSGANKSKVR